MKKRLVILVMASLLLGACVRSRVEYSFEGKKTEPGSNEQKHGLDHKHVKNLRLLEGELSMKIMIKDVFDNRKLVGLNQEMKLMPYENPQLHLWCAEPTDHYNQIIQEVVYSITPSLVYEDKENGNRIAYWNLTSRLPGTGKQDTIEIRRRIRLIRSEPDYQIEPAKIEDYDKNGSLYKFYTKSEEGVEITDEILTKAEAIVGDETNPYLKAKMIFQWILDNANYKYPPEKRGAKFMFESLEGDCGEYSSLFCAMCRAVEVPARFVSGLWFGDKFGFHAWSEFYLPGYGWVPADASMADSGDGDYKWEYFGWLENTRLTPSRGNNIPLKNAPDWTNYANSDVENSVTPFMQFSTMAAFGIDYEVKRDYKSIVNEAVRIDQEEEWTTFTP